MKILTMRLNNFMLPSSVIEILTVIKENKICTRGRFWKRTSDKKQQKRYLKMCTYASHLIQTPYEKNYLLSFFAPIISFKSPSIWRGTAVRNVRFYFFLLQDERLPSPLGCGPTLFPQARQHTCKQFYWNQGIFMQSNSFSASRTWSLESKLLG